MQITGNASLRHFVEEWLRRPTRQTGIADIPELSCCVGTTMGEVRPENQDRAIVARLTNPGRAEQSFLVCLVCDGMGGMAEGSRCSEIAIGAFLESLIGFRSISPDCIRNAAMQANRAVYSAYKGRGGTTLAALIFGPFGKAIGVTVGDSRLYEFSLPGRLKQVSIDDTIAGELQRLRGSHAPEGQFDDFSNRLAQYIGIGEGLEPRTYDLNTSSSKSAYLLSTDGIHTIAASTLEEIITSAPSLYVAVTRMVNVSRWCGGKDNASAICIQPKTPNSPERRQQGVNLMLEMWDSFTKLELIWPTNVHVSERFSEQLHLPSRPSPTTTRESSRPTSEQEPGSGKHSKEKRPRKTISKEAKSKPTQKPAHAAPQGELEIQIVETARNPDAKQQSEEPKSEGTSDQKNAEIPRPDSDGAPKPK